MIAEKRHHLEEKTLLSKGTTQLLAPSLAKINISSCAATDNEKEEILIYTQAHHRPKLFTGFEFSSLKQKAQLYQT